MTAQNDALPDETLATEDEPPLFPPAPKLRWRPGLPIFLGSGFLTFLLMANQGHVPGGVTLGALLCVIATLSLLDVLGSFEVFPGTVTLQAKPRLGRSALLCALGIVAFVAATRMAVAGVLPGSMCSAAVLIPGALLFTLVMLYRSVADLGAFGEASSRVTEHPSFWLLAITIAIYTPMLGSFSLIDPWETHYGEVAREILSRDDWISLWWAQDGWFWSKPILDFWLQALSFALFGVRHAPDTMLFAITQGRMPYPEWAARLPILLFSLVGQVLLYAGVRKVWGRQIALLGSLLLVVVPHYAIIAHQSMTDLPYIAALMGAMGLFLLGLFCPPDAEVNGYGLSLFGRRLVFSASTLVIGLLVLFTLPQLIYLLTRNIALITNRNDPGFFFHLDQFFSGSGGGNCGLPSNEACSRQFPVNSRPQPALSALLWSVLLGVFLLINRGERRRQRWYFIGAWFLIALSFMAKGLPGPVIAIATLGVALTLMQRWNDFERLELTSGVLIFAFLALPWFAQMTARHGPAFLERLFVHDMYKRAFIHVHDTNAGDDTSIRYYLWQLGYGLFPASGFVAVASLGSLLGRGVHRDRKHAMASFLAAWFLVGFAMFTLSLTKFHHYVIAIVPPLCMLAGRPLSHLFGNHSNLDLLQARTWFRTVATNARRSTEVTPRRANAAALRLLLVVSACLITWFVGCDFFSNAKLGPARLINLVTYSYTRPWPTQLSMVGSLRGFTLATVIVMLGWVGTSRLRRLSTLLFLASCIGFALFVCNVYLPRIAPHWGQRDTIAEYYRRRRGPEEPLVAFQMNWKGENFYTGNRVPAFVTTGEPFKKYVTDQRIAGHRILYFSIEPTRFGNLRNDLGKYTRFDVITDSWLNNKFSLVRVEL
jgi:4-amino-4-deoxy-L-arabinose transferase-like glycosyltransferase